MPKIVLTCQIDSLHKIFKTALKYVPKQYTKRKKDDTLDNVESTYGMQQVLQLADLQLMYYWQKAVVC